MKLDPEILQDLAVPFAPTAYVRVTPLAHAATPLGMGYGDTRFASPTGACICVFERAVPALHATPVAVLVTLPDFIAALQALNVLLEPAP